MVTKGQKLKTYSQELKLKAIKMKLEGMTKRQISEELGIEDHDRVITYHISFNNDNPYMQKSGVLFRDTEDKLPVIEPLYYSFSTEGCSFHYDFLKHSITVFRVKY